MSVAVIAEKPSVARDIAKTLGASLRGDGYLHGNGYVVTWAVGHLVELAQPGAINPDWRGWRRDTLPMLPESWPLVVIEATRDQFEVVRHQFAEARHQSEGWLHRYKVLQRHFERLLHRSGMRIRSSDLFRFLRRSHSVSADSRVGQLGLRCVGYLN